jgi:hypothetical protein
MKAGIPEHVLIPDPVPFDAGDWGDWDGRQANTDGVTRDFADS